MWKSQFIEQNEIAVAQGRREETNNMALKKTVQNAVVAWSNCPKHILPSFTSRKNPYTSARNCDHQILKSPPLVSLDSPEMWNSDTVNCSPPTIHKCTTEQTARVIDGKSIAEEIRSEIAVEVKRMKETIGKVPGLGVILIGQRRDSQTYVRKKIEACEEAGIRYAVTELPDTCTDDDVCDALSSFNGSPSFHGILMQLPIPQHLSEGKILDLLSLEKDVDGFHPLNMGNLAMRGREPLFISCTPKGCVELLLRSDVEISGKKAVVIGRSNIVGLPMSLLLQRHNATVSIVDAFTKDPEKIASEADILVTAVGVPNLVRRSWLKPGTVVIDVGTHPVEDSCSEYGYRLVGDVCYEEALSVASAITPVPGGVGPMTIAMLLFNTLEAAKRKYNLVQRTGVSGINKFHMDW